jgi:hypothetical protein
MTRPDDDLPEGMQRREISYAEARAHLDRGLGYAPVLVDHPDTAKITARLRLIAHYAESMPEGFELPTREPLADEARDELVDDFLSSAHGRTLVDDPHFGELDATRDLVRSVVETAHDVLNGKPLRLTPQSVVLIPLARRDEDATDDDPRLRPLLRALVAYAHDRNGWADRHLDATLAEIDSSG